MKLLLKKNKLKIPLTHMADIAYLLLIFIIIFSLISTRDKSRDMAPDSESGTESQDEGYILYITDNHIDFNSKVFTDTKELEAEFKTSDSSRGITIIADKQIQFGKIKTILNMLKEHRFSPIDFLILKKR
jgi:biopolymer transport protein ExbD